MRKHLLDMRKYFLIISNFYLAQILREPNSLAIVASKKLLKISNYVLIMSICFSQNENQEFAVHGGRHFYSVPLLPTIKIFPMALKNDLSMLENI